MKKIIALSLAMGLMPVNAIAADIQFLTHSASEQTYFDENGELRGDEYAGKRAFHVELVRAMMERMNHPDSIINVPLKRAIHTVQNENNIAVFNLSRTPARENTVKWVGPLQTETGYLFEMKNRPTGITTLEDAKNVNRICVVRGGVHEKDLLKQNFTNLIQHRFYEDCFRMLQAGRVQLTPAASQAVAEKLTKAGISIDQIQQTPVMVTQSVGYLVFSKNVPDDVIQQWQDALDAIKASGQFQQLYQQFSFRVQS